MEKKYHIYKETTLSYIFEVLARRPAWPPDRKLSKKIKEFWITYRQALECSNNPHSHYTKRKNPKSDGSFRTIYVPDSVLRMHQRNILENYLSQVAISDRAYAYCKGKNCKQVAAAHCYTDNDEMLKLDIKNFFGSIRADMVYDAFKRNFNFERDLIAMLTGICCIDGHLPQGASTSAALSNIIMVGFDEVVSYYCRERNITYTRYSDDMYFSYQRSNVNPSEIIEFVKNQLKSRGFALNNKKTRVVKRSGQKWAVLGICTNEKLQADKVYRKKIRQEMYYIDKYGLREHITHISDNVQDEELYDVMFEYIDSMMGRVNYVLYINPFDEEMESYKKRLMLLKSNLEFECNSRDYYEDMKRKRKDSISIQFFCE